MSSSDFFICCVVLQESALSATKPCMEPTRPAKLWVASTTTTALPAALAVSKNTCTTHLHWVLLLPFKHFHLLSSVDSHVNFSHLLNNGLLKTLSSWFISGTFLFSRSLSRAKTHSYLGITVLCCWCLVSGCASHSSSPHRARLFAALVHPSVNKIAFSID